VKRRIRRKKENFLKVLSMFLDSSVLALALSSLPRASGLRGPHSSKKEGPSSCRLL